MSEQKPLIREYSPNIEWGKQHVEIVLMAWGYSRTFEIDVGGNRTGLDVISCAVENLDEELQGTVELSNAEGDTLLCEDDDDLGEEWLKSMVVSARIIGWTPPTLNEVRKINGAAPVADGDQPWRPM